MTNIDRRYVLATLVVGTAVGAASAKAAPKELSLAQMKKETEVACLYHCDFGDDRRCGARGPRRDPWQRQITPPLGVVTTTCVDSSVVGRPFTRFGLPIGQRE
ncbi:MAG: hypothetical protein Q8M18_20545 [Bradyrhizobium sp.]|nr:hypothetical protein [Bradyrhizobium sp.]